MRRLDQGRPRRPGDSDTRPGVALGEIKQELMADESQDSPKSTRMRANKQKK